MLKIEFSRISVTRRGALTLVIDPHNGVLTTVAYCLSIRATIAEAIDDLRVRERTTWANIGFWQRNSEMRTGDIVAPWPGAAGHEATQSQRREGA